ncbi:DUF4192 domain-containing protein [Arsenicicoccus dermatophilus]|uniref:DUF4192 domain-containing protein n=1 Tax=Arsenicicoccus dermatophilus TaxID=1076331 RepID=UPI001F4CF9CE|nr:DUF4192 domain-containing protein [Arsenicicoccus dermatophilus]MCH8613250.1 DUF4192 domain-containing protein [Arsenicicoccus dermatophilus]
MSTSAPPADRPALTAVVRDVGQLVTVVPYVLGFTPSDSLVVLGLRSRPGARRPTIGPAVRIDLHDPAGDPQPLRAGPAWDAVAVRMLPHVDEVVLVAFTDRAGPGAGRGVALGGSPREASSPDPLSVAEAEQLLAELLALATAAGTQVRDAVMVSGGTWWPVTCDDPVCCPRDPVALPRPEQVPAVTELVVAGEAPAATREARLAGTRPDRDHPVARAVARTLGRAPTSGTARPGPPSPEDVEAGLRAWRVLLGLGGSACVAVDGGGSGDVEQVAGLVAAAVHAIEDVHVRDGIYAWVVPGLCSPDDVRADVRETCRAVLGSPVRRDHRELRRSLGRRLLDVARVLPDDHAAPTLTAAAVVAWSLDDHMVATAACERALTCDPGYGMARLTMSALRGLARFDEVVGGFRRMR